MRQLSLNPLHSIKLYQTVHELPARRHLAFNTYIVQQGGIGSTPDDINQRFSRTGQLIAAGMLQEAGTELANLHYAFHFALEQFSPQQLAFGCLIAEVDGQPVTDYSEAALQALLEQVSEYGLTMEMVTTEVEDVKKNYRLS
ncbi:hypothetical protein SAMN06265337_0629 [Hymenobacter gelipurpurascens]|uniref:Uncharacterized protein n=1 Tax=Hymenobacter gelipurpurascens TaxID=89968 RepID=A0A212T871_9BACT|nr:hypothetical protein [Hymenobacter gelipurpurascens]SNC62232.1 hypothetical protein SAMN06265337_0629 [Hymenobacter gelipurpurascens]